MPHLVGYFKQHDGSQSSPISLHHYLLALSLGFVLWLIPVHAQSEPIAVIVHAANPVTTLQPSDVAAIYRGEELMWDHGGRIKLVNREISSPLRKRFYRKILNANPDQKFYRPGTPIAIQSLIQRSDDAVLRFVSSIQGAIGYVAASTLEQSKFRDSVKVVLLIDP